MPQEMPVLPENVAYIVFTGEEDQMLVAAEMARFTTPNEFIVTTGDSDEILTVGGSENLADALATMIGHLTGKTVEVTIRVKE